MRRRHDGIASGLWLRDSHSPDSASEIGHIAGAVLLEMSSRNG